VPSAAHWLKAEFWLPADFWLKAATITTIWPLGQDLPNLATSKPSLNAAVITA
jgi:hypothetical protein